MIVEERTEVIENTVVTFKLDEEEALAVRTLIGALTPSETARLSNSSLYTVRKMTGVEQNSDRLKELWASLYTAFSDVQNKEAYR